MWSYIKCVVKWKDFFIHDFTVHILNLFIILLLLRLSCEIEWGNSTTALYRCKSTYYIYHHMTIPIRTKTILNDMANANGKKASRIFFLLFFNSFFYLADEVTSVAWIGSIERFPKIEFLRPIPYNFPLSKQNTGCAGYCITHIWFQLVKRNKKEERKKERKTWYSTKGTKWSIHFSFFNWNI